MEEKTIEEQKERKVRDRQEYFREYYRKNKDRISEYRKRNRIML